MTVMSGNPKVDSIVASMNQQSEMAKLVEWNFDSFDKQNQSLRLSFVIKKMFSNPMGMVHGGFVATMLDEVMGTAIFFCSEGQAIATTITSTIDYIKPAPCGALECEAKVTNLGKSVAFLEGKLLSPEGDLLARATGTYRLIPFDIGHFAPNKM